MGPAASRWPRILAGLAAVVAGLDFFGWMARIPLLVGEGMTPSTMKFVTAVGVLFMAGALYLRARSGEEPSPHAAATVRTLGAITVVLAIGVLIARSPLQTPDAIAVRDLIDRAPDGVSHGLPSVLTGLVFGLLGIWAVADARNRAPAVTVAVCVVVLAVCVLAVVGIVFHVSARDESYFTQLAAPTVLAYAALAFGMLWLRPDYGLARVSRDRGAGGLAFRRLVLASIGIPFVFGWLRLLSHESGWVDVVPGIAVYALVMMLAFSAVSWVVSLQLAALDKERDAAERERRVVERRFRSAFDHAGIGMAIVGLDGRWVEFNDSLETMLGYPRDVLRSKTFQDITHPDDLLTDLVLASELIAGTRSSYSLDKRYFRHDGSTMHVTLTGSLIRDDAGNPLHSLATIQDITVRVEAERALREAYQLQRGITEGADLAIISADLNGIIRLFNPGAERMLGYRAEDVVGRATPAIIHIGEEVAARAAELTLELGIPIEPGFEAFVAKVREGGADQREWTYVRKDGSTLRVLLSVTALRGADGKAEAFLGIASDVSALHATRQALETANREKEVLLREVHHRVKNNLQVVSSMLNLQAGYSNDPAIVQMFDDSRERVRAMALIHERLQGSTGFGSVDFTAFASDLVALFRLASEQLRPGVMLVVEGDPVQVPLDMATPLGLVLNELVSNALKYAFEAQDRGRVVVRIAGDAREFRMTVTNGTRSIPPSFDLATGKTLGLRLVRALVNQIDGSVQVITEPEPALAVHAPWPRRGEGEHA